MSTAPDLGRIRLRAEIAQRKFQAGLADEAATELELLLAELPTNGDSPPSREGGGRPQTARCRQAPVTAREGQRRARGRQAAAALARAGGPSRG